ncbi:MAG: hypothetical protein KDA96_09180 [Planctomycetaceae bacterium]|nr:hypothetical protein [Planctomycetaceae bacterium]
MRNPPFLFRRGFAGRIVCVMLGSALIATPSSVAVGQNGDREDTARTRVNWCDNDAIPFLKAETIAPIKERQQFTSRSAGAYWEFQAGEMLGGVGTNSRVTGEEQAEMLARLWVGEHFGEMPEHASLEIVKIVRRDVPDPDNDGVSPVYVVFLKENFHGMMTCNFANVVIRKGRVQTALVDLRRYTPFGGYQKCISKEHATKAMREFIQKRGASAEQLRHFDESIELRLMYSWSPQPLKDEEFLIPLWDMGEKGGFLIDARTGVVRFED